jgi:hypothetical protein
MKNASTFCGPADEMPRRSIDSDWMSVAILLASGDGLFDVFTSGLHI